LAGHVQESPLPMPPILPTHGELVVSAASKD